MSFFKRWTPFGLVTLGYLILLRIVLSSLNQLGKIYSLKPLSISLHINPDHFDFIDVLTVLFYKMWICSPVEISLGDSVSGQLAHFVIDSCYGLSLTALGLYTWMLSTKVHIEIGKRGVFHHVFWSGKRPRWIMFYTMMAAFLLQFIIFVTLPIYHYLIPNLNESSQTYSNTMYQAYHPGIKNLKLWDMILLLLPVLPALGIVGFLYRKWKEHEVDDIKTVFEEWEYKNPFISRTFSSQDKTQYPDIIIGLDAKTNELVVQSGEDRNLNNLICGSIGTGKTAARIQPELNQDLNYMCEMINNFSYETDAERANRVNGIIVIEPSNDLCEKVYQLALSHNIPEEAIYYLNPLDKNTQCINPLRGPIEKAVETFTMIIQGLAANSDEFFKQSQRSHLKHYVYLLKLSKQNDATFDDLMELYNDARAVADLLEEVEKTIPAGWEQIADRDERNHWLIVRGVCAWFRERGLLYLEDRNQMKLTYPAGHKHSGKQMVVDKQAEYVQGLRNILDDISASKLIRRVLFGNSDFDIDTHLKAGGMLLVNTAKGDLMDLSNVLGKFILLMAQNGIFRRDPKSRDPYHHIVVDEFPDYIYEQFQSVPAQSRKYKTIITTASQSLAQLSASFGDDYMYTLVATFRHKMVYADVDPKTAKIFSEFFGEESIFESTHSENVTSSMMSSPRRAEGVSVKKSDKAVITPSQIINLKPFQGALKLAKEDFRIVKANFVKASEFKKAKVRVEEGQEEAWLEYRKQITKAMEDQMLRDMGILHEGSSNDPDAVPVKELQKLQAIAPHLPILVDNRDRRIIEKLTESPRKEEGKSPTDGGIVIDINAYRPRQRGVEQVEPERKITESPAAPASPPVKLQEKSIKNEITVVATEQAKIKEEAINPLASIYNQAVPQNQTKTPSQTQPLDVLEKDDKTANQNPTPVKPITSLVDAFLSELRVEPSLIEKAKGSAPKEEIDITELVASGQINIESHSEIDKPKQEKVLTETDLFKELQGKT